MRALRLFTPVLFLLYVACPRSGSTVPKGGGDGSGSGSDVVQTEPDLPLWSEIRTGVLPNGLTYYVLPHERPQERAYLWLAVNAGSVQEDDDQRGLAHFVEHMAFNGTKRFEKHAIIDYIESIGMDFGADLNAHTSFDETVYKLMVPTDDPKIVDTGLDILRDWAGDITFDPDEVEAERGVVLEEWRLGLGAWDRVYDKQAPVLFKDSRYAVRNTIGKADILKNAPVEALVRYYEDWYRPDLMAVIVVGDVDPDAIEKQIERKFGDLDKPTDPRPRIHGEVPPADGTRISITTDPELPNTTIQIVNLFEHRPESTKSDYRRLMLDFLYGRMLNERLTEISQRADSPFLYAASGTGDQTLEIDGFSRYAAVKDGRLDDALSTLFAEVRRVEKHGFTATELERAKKAQLRGMHQSAKTIHLADGFELVDELTRTFFEKELNVGRVAEAELADEIVPTITLDEVLAHAATWGQDENRVILISGPSTLKAPNEDHVEQVIAKVEAQDLQPWVDAESKPLIAKAPAAGSITKEEIRLDGGVTWTLSNGAKVAIKATDFEADTILMTGFSPGGTGQASDKQWPHARFAADLITAGGAGEHSAVQLGRLLSDSVVNLGVWIGETEEGMSGQASAADLEKLMQLAWLRVTAPRKDEQAFEVWKQGMLDWVKNRRVMPESAFYEDMEKVLTKDHPRRKPAETSDVDKLDLDQALAFYQDRFADVSDFTFVIVGNVDVDKLRPLVETYLASLPGGGRVEKRKDPGIKRPKGVTKKQFKQGVEPKASVLLSFFADQKWTREDAIDLDLVVQVLQLRLFDRMREKMGGVYGVGVWGWIERSPHQERVLQANFSCAPENLAKLEEAMFDEFALLQKDGVTDAEIAQLTETAKRHHEGELIDNQSWASWIAESYRYGDDLDVVMDLDVVLDRITKKTIQAAAKKLLDNKQYVLGELVPADTAAGAK